MTTTDAAEADIEAVAQALWQVQPLTRENVRAAARRALQAAGPRPAADRRDDCAPGEPPPLSAEMAEVVAAHVPTRASIAFDTPEPGSGRYCRCGHFVAVLHSAVDDNRSTDSYLDQLLAAHVAMELAKAGYGKLPKTTAGGLAGVAGRLQRLARRPRE